MKYYQVVAAYIELAGKLHLTDAQASAREHKLERLDAKAHGENRFATKAPVGFKRGEVLGFDGELPKGLAGALQVKDIDFERRVKADRAVVATLREKARKEREVRAAEVKRRRVEIEMKQRARLEEARKDAAARHAKGPGLV